MDFDTDHFIALTPQQTWHALNEPAILQGCIPGCERFEADGPGYSVAVRARVGPWSSTFNGRVRIDPLDPPRAYVLHFDGDGGFATARSEVRLEPAHEAGTDGTRMHCRTGVVLGGRLAMLGSALTEPVARRALDAFFKRFAERARAAGDA